MPGKPTYEELEKQLRELKQEHRGLRESEGLYYKLIDFSPLPFLVTQKEKIVFANPAAAKLFGTGHQDELVGSSPQDWIHPDFVEQTYKRRRRIIETGESVEPVEMTLLRQDKTEAVVLSNATRIIHNGSPALLSVFHDITARKRAEDALRESEQFRGRVIQSLVSGLYIYNLKKLHNDFISDQYTVLTGWTLDEINEMGQRFIELFHPEDRSCVEEHFRKVQKAKDGEVLEIEYRFRTKDGRWIWCISRDTVFERNEHGDLTRFIGSFFDITERKRAEEKLWENEALLNRSQQMASLGSFVWDLRNDALLWSKNMYAIHGVNEECFAGNLSEISRQLIHADDRGRIQAEIQKMIEDGRVWSMEFRVIRPDGEERIMRSSGEFELDEQGRPVKCFGVHQDITERKQAEEELSKSEAMTKALLNGIPESAFLIESDGTIISANTTVAERLNCPMEDLIGSNIYTRVSHEVSEFRRKFVDQAVQTEKPFQFEDVRSGRNIDNRINPILDQHGKVTRVAIVGIDITEQKRTEEALRESEDFLNRTGDMAQVGGWEVNLDTMKVVWTKTTGRIHELPHGYFPDLEEAISYYHPEDQDHVRQCVQRAIESSEPFDFTVRLITAKGRERWVRALGQPIFDSGSCVRLSGTFQDITERLKLEEELRQSQKLEAIGTLAGGIAHDFNNILGIIVGNTELAMFDVPEWSPAQESLKEVREASLRARDLVTQILLFARQKEHTVSNIRVEAPAKESLKMLRATIPTTVDIQQEIQEGLPSVLADAAQIQQIIMNLCTNAGQVMESEGGVLIFQLDLAELNAPTDTLAGRIPQGRYVRIRVQDTGPGISPENLERIFEPFFTTKGVGEGTGLGLAVVHGIVQDRHGGILVESEAGKGTLFTVYLPASEEKPAEGSAEGESELPKGNERVLFVDDEPMILRLGQRMLERQGYTVKTCASGSDALTYFRQDPDRFDLVITDMTMPGLRGDKLAEEMLKIRSEIPVILSTGFSKQISEERAKELGIRAFVMKPLTAHELANTVRGVLDDK